MRVLDIMTRDVRAISMDEMLGDVQTMFESESFHHLIVLGEEGEVVGVVSDRDVLREVSPFVGKLAERTADLASVQKRVHQFMSRNPVTVTPEWDAAEAGRRMLRENISCLPVLGRGGQLVGIVTVRDIARLGIALAEQMRPDADVA